MTRDELLDRLRLHEDSFVERKSEGDDAWRKTIVAFANSVPTGRVAILFLGVLNDGTIQGLGNPDKLQKTLNKFCRETCYPSVSFATELLQLDGKSVLAVQVPPSHDRPHFAGPAFVRQGSESLRANEAQFRDLITSRSGLAAELLRYRGSLVTVATAKGALGFPEYAATKAGTSVTARFRARECTVVEVNSFFARFQENDTCFSEPLRNIQISYDEKKHRPLVIIHLDGA